MPIQGVAFVVIVNGHLLIEERPESDCEWGGFNLIPGGKCIEGEEPEKALLRETAEELGIKVTGYESLSSFGTPSFTGRYYFIHAFLVTSYRGEIQNLEE